MQESVVNMIKDMTMKEQSKFLEKFDKYVTESVEKMINIERISIKKMFDKSIRELNLDLIIEKIGKNDLYDLYLFRSKACNLSI